MFKKILISMPILILVFIAIYYFTFGSLKKGEEYYTEGKYDLSTDQFSPGALRYRFGISLSSKSDSLSFEYIKKICKKSTSAILNDFIAKFLFDPWFDNSSHDIQLCKVYLDSYNKDFFKAKERLNQLGEEGDIESLLLLGHCYLVGELSFEIDYNMAISSYEKISPQNYESLKMLADIYSSHNLITPPELINYKLAREYYLESLSSYKNSDAFLGLARLYQLGLGTEIDQKTSITLINNAIEINSQIELSEYNKRFIEIYERQKKVIRALDNLYYYTENRDSETLTLIDPCNLNIQYTRFIYGYYQGNTRVSLQNTHFEYVSAYDWTGKYEGVCIYPDYKGAIMREDSKGGWEYPDHITVENDGDDVRKVDARGIYDSFKIIYWNCENEKSLEEYNVICNQDSISKFREIIINYDINTIGGLNSFEIYKSLLISKKKSIVNALELLNELEEKRRLAAKVEEMQIQDATNNPYNPLYAILGGKDNVESIKKIFSTLTKSTDSGSITITVYKRGFLFDESLEKAEIIIVHEQTGQKYELKTGSSVFWGTSGNATLYSLPPGKFKIRSPYMESEVTVDLGKDEYKQVRILLD